MNSKIVFLARARSKQFKAKKKVFFPVETNMRLFGKLRISLLQYYFATCVN